MTTRHVPLAISLPFVAAFTAFELGLYFAGFFLPGGEAGFTASVVGHLFLINALALGVVVAASQLAATFVAQNNGSHLLAPPDRFA